MAELSGKIEFRGHYPGVLGRVIALHGDYYHRHWGFDKSFETQVGTELCAFMTRFDERFDFFEAALLEGSFAGAIVIDGQGSADQGARLRWFIVDEGAQGQGVGRLLIERALAFCGRAGHERVFLWTFEGLDPARRLYERAGFLLTEEDRVDQWGVRGLLEQRFEVSLVFRPLI